MAPAPLPSPYAQNTQWICHDPPGTLRGQKHSPVDVPSINWENGCEESARNVSGLLLDDCSSRGTIRPLCGRVRAEGRHERYAGNTIEQTCSTESRCRHQAVCAKDDQRPHQNLERTEVTC